MPTGTIKNIVHLSDSTDLPTAHLVPSQNTVGYGYIVGHDGRTVFFDHDAIEGMRFEELAAGQQVEYSVESAAYLRAISVRAAAEPVKSPVAASPAITARLASLADDAVDEASEESFPASDPPASTPVLGVGRHGK